jgi:uncharacterized membrane protein YkvA (DUF1232 family)
MTTHMPPLEGEILPPEHMARDERIVREGFWRQLRRFVGRIPFAEDIVATYYCAFDSNTPLTARAVLLGAVAYFVTPLDMIPDFIPMVGFTDDATVLATAIAVAGAHIRAWHRASARQALLIDARR